MSLRKTAAMGVAGGTANDSVLPVRQALLAWEGQVSWQAPSNSRVEAHRGKEL
jgi:hypothetical protein